MVRRLSALGLLGALAAGCAAPPQRDVFVPPYAEKGCWARLYERPAFAGAMRQLEGPSFIESVEGHAILVPNLDEAGVQPLFSEVRSLAVGPHARLIGYGETLFRSPSLSIAPGSELPDVSRISFQDRVASFELLCEADPVVSAGRWRP